jgi:hypothetical protein
MEEGRSIGDLLENLPTWLYFLLIIGSMCYIVLYPLGLPIPVTQLTRDSYEAVNQLEEGDIILVDMGYESGTLALMEPGFVVVFKHAIQRGAKLVILSTATESPMLFGRALDFINPEPKGYEYGIDYVHLGYIAGGEAAYAGILQDINGVFSEDYQGTPVGDLPLMQEVASPTHEKLDLVVVYTAGGDVIEGWIRQAPLRYGIPLITEVNEMMVPTIQPYYPINCAGIINGGIGAAEYEAVAGIPGEAIKLSDMLTAGGLVVLVFLILGNIGFYMKKGGGQVK